MYVCLSVMPHYATCVLIVLCTVRPHWRSHCASSLCVLIVHPHCEPLLSVLILRPEPVLKNSETFAWPLFLV